MSKYTSGDKQYTRDGRSNEIQLSEKVTDNV